MNETDAMRREVDQLRERIAFLESLILSMMGGQKTPPVPTPEPVPSQPPFVPYEPWNPNWPYGIYCGGTAVFKADRNAVVTI